MALGNTKFYPSKVEDRIYDLMNEDKYLEEDTYIYKCEILTAIVNLLFEEFKEVEFEMQSARTLQPDVFICHLYWIENGHLHSTNWMYREEFE